MHSRQIELLQHSSSQKWKEMNCQYQVCEKHSYDQCSEAYLLYSHHDKSDKEFKINCRESCNAMLTRSSLVAAGDSSRN